MRPEARDHVTSIVYSVISFCRSIAKLACSQLVPVGYASELFDATSSKSRGHRDYKIKNTSHYLSCGLRDAAHSAKFSPSPKSHLAVNRVTGLCDGRLVPAVSVT